jgi:hypothetical protein
MSSSEALHPEVACHRSTPLFCFSGFGGRSEIVDFWGPGGPTDVTKPYEFIGFGAMDVTKPYEFIGFGAMDVTKPYEVASRPQNGEVRR